MRNSPGIAETSRDLSDCENNENDPGIYSIPMRPDGHDMKCRCSIRIIIIVHHLCTAAVETKKSQILSRVLIGLNTMEQCDTLMALTRNTYL